MGINISLVLAFRQRVNRLQELIDSLVATTKDLASVEMVLAVDKDDEVGLNFVRNTLFPMPVQILECYRSEHFSKDYINPLARMSKGRWIINLNDDSVFKTNNWDALLLKEMNLKADKAGDDIFLGLIKDGMTRTGEDKLYPHFSSWPVVSKESIEAVGYFFNEKFYIWGGDHFIANVYRRLGRLVSLTNIHIDHNSHHNKLRYRDEQDINYERFCAIETVHGFTITHDMVIDEAFEFELYLKNKHGESFELKKGPATVY